MVSLTLWKIPLRLSATESIVILVSDWGMGTNAMFIFFALSANSIQLYHSLPFCTLVVSSLIDHFCNLLAVYFFVRENVATDKASKWQKFAPLSPRMSGKTNPL